MIYDIAIIGAGIIGSSIARELSKYKIKTCLIEKENDIASGTSKANSGIIHAGYDPLPGSLMAKFNIQGSKLFPKLSEELKFDYKKISSLVLGFDEHDEEVIKDLYKRGKENGVENLKLLNQSEVLKLEENLNPEVKIALLAEDAAIISPYMATWAFAENAVENEVELFLEEEVHEIKSPENENEFWKIKTSKKNIQAKIIINAAGLFADKISKMAGAKDFKIIPRKGEYFLLDNKSKNLTKRILFQSPGKLGKGVLVTQTVDGNILIGPSASESISKEDTSTSREGLDFIIKKAELTIPNIPKRNIINSFSGLRAIPYDKDNKKINDFIIEEDSQKKGFINVAGICSPGLTCAPAIAIYVTELCEKSLNTKLEKKDKFVNTRKKIENFKEASLERKAELVENNKLYGNIICRCEMISEAEIVEAIHSIIGAKDLDGIKRRVRAGMGRCQGGFCSPKVTEILSRELKIEMTSVSKKGGCSFILNSKTR